MSPFPEIPHIILGFFIALGVSLIVVPLVRQWALNAGHIDRPGGRKLHATAVPRLGGVGIFAGFAAAFLTLMLWSWHYPHGESTAGLLAGGAIIFVIGLLDDLFDLSAYVKLGGQILAAVVAYLLGVQVLFLDLPWSKVIYLYGLSLPITVLWMVGITNAMNFIDGVDGLAGGVMTFSAITMAIVAIFTGQDVAALFSALLAGASLGFLVYNFYPAKIFMGDAGALFGGFMLAGISVTGVLKTPIVVMLLPILVLSVPILDITYSTMRRLLTGRNPFVADADHLHHRLLKAGFSPLRTTLFFYGICFLAGLLAAQYVQDLKTYLVVVGAVYGLGAVLLICIRQKDLLITLKSVPPKTVEPGMTPESDAEPAENTLLLGVPSVTKETP